MLQQLINGATLGSVYALFAVGLTIVFGVLNMLNMAHIAVFTSGAYTGLTLLRWGVPLWLAIPTAMAACGALGVLVDRVAYRPLRSRINGGLAGLVASVGVLFVLEACLLGMFGEKTRTLPQGTYPTRVFEPIAGLRVSAAQLILIVVTIVVMVALSRLMNATAWGRRVRAVAESPTAAAVTGTNIERIYMSTFFVSSALGGLAGVLFALQYNSLTVTMGHAVVVQGLAALVIGGMTSIYGAALGGLLLGLVEVFTVQWIGSEWKNVLAFVVLFVLLAAKPSGLFGMRAMRVA